MDKVLSVPDEWKNLLNDSQIEAIETTKGPVLIIAGAGSGKTRVLTYRYAHLVKSYGVDIENILAITFTNKAAEEMKSRISDLLNLEASPKWVSTFHSLCVKILRIHGDKLGFNRNFSIYDQSDSNKVVRNCMSDNNVDLKQYSPKRFQAQISNLKNNMINPKEALEIADTFFDVKVAEIYISYEKKLKQANAMDFDDLLLKTVELFEKFESVLSFWAGKFQFVMVDEYQDTNFVQYKLVELLGSNNKNVCVVGDSDQSIYAFRGADIRNIIEFEKDFENAKIIQLEKNYRSTKKILNLANQIISNNQRTLDKNLWTDNEEGLDVDSIQFRSERDEANWVSLEIKKILEENKNDEVAVFYRTNSQSRLFEEELRKNNINYKVLGSVRFYDRKEIKDIICYLKFILNNDDMVSFERIVNVPRRGIGDSTIGKIRGSMDILNKNLSQILKNPEEVDNISPRIKSKLKEFYVLIEELKSVAIQGPSKTIKEIINKTGYKSELINEGTLESQMRLENIEELMNSAFNFENLNESEIDEPFTVLREYLESIALFADTDDLEESDRVTLMTLHNAKGLEFPFVFMTGMEENLFPHERSTQGGKKEIEEERRLCYVGITRAEKKLYLTYSWSRTLWGGTTFNLPSRFIEEGKDFLANIEIKELNSTEKEIGKNISIGSKVLHDKYGEGNVLEVNGNEITVNFNNDIGVKYLDIEWAPIKFI
ncbi:MAG: UvrD-helicase domain-containing protein [Actinomycetota bacterium]|nr:UvrD-helicase domain-containing protein [Actinomycetota bacterium]MDA3013618.1 UvrD-helicase domain-containing protein [Actinomycetota bacterium]